MKILVTGGAGFIGSAFVKVAIQQGHQVLNLDKLTYSGNLESLTTLEKNSNYSFTRVDICNRQLVEQAFANFQPQAVLHLAAESHVDRSIDAPRLFIETNVLGSYTMLDVARHYWADLPGISKGSFRFVHVSTDEVYGSLGTTGLFREDSPYRPNSPYSASKAASDHLARAWFHTYGLPVITTNCSNNYGPFQFPEKLIPLMILTALSGKNLPVYGNGENIRDWLYVEDHARALLLALEKGRPGEAYNIGGRNERTNLEVVRTICSLLDHLKPSGRSYHELITFVTDRPGHDMRYAIDASKIEAELGWAAKENFDSGIKKTVEWYIENSGTWCRRVLDGSYQMERLGVQEP